MELKKTFGLFDALNIGIGAGISAFTALSFAELASFIPKEGGGYEFAHELVSPFAGFIAGWLWLLSNVVVGAVVSLGFAIILQYLSHFP